jgi:hypothetical protein
VEILTQKSQERHICHLTLIVCTFGMGLSFDLSNLCMYLNIFYLCFFSVLNSWVKSPYSTLQFTSGTSPLVPPVSGEFFTTFERRQNGIGKNIILTIVSKLCMKYIWECRNRSCLPQNDHCWENISNKISRMLDNNSKFDKLWRSTEFSLENPPL